MEIYKNGVLLFVNLIQIFIHKLCKINEFKVFYFPVNLKKSGNAMSILKEWSKNERYHHIYLTNEHYCEGSRKNVSFCSFNLKTIYHYSTAKYIIRESEFCSIGLLPHKHAFIIQLWHAAGAFKKMALDIEDRSLFLKFNRKRDVSSWDLLLCSSETLVDIYSKAFGGFDKSKIFVGGLPRNDVLHTLSLSRKNLRDNHGFCPEIKVILFAPTFRDKASDGDYNKIIYTINMLPKMLPAGFSLAVRLHPIMVDDFTLDESVVNLGHCSVEEALVAVDILVTDYSSIIFDFALLGKPMCFYVPDLSDYYDRRGFYFDYTGFVPGPICDSGSSLLEAIVSYDEEEWLPIVADFRNKYNPHFDGMNSKRVLERILLDN